MHRSILLAPLFLGACIVQGNGEVIAESREIGDFTAIVNASFVRVALGVGPVTDALLECDENLIPRILTDVVDGTLTIETRGNLQTTTACRLQVFAPNVRDLTASGSGSIEVDGTVADVNRVTLTGSGDITLGPATGTTLDVQNTGSGDITISELTSTAMDVLATGSGDIVLDGTVTTLTVRLTGSGDIDAEGLEAVDVEVVNSGSGQMDVYATDEVSGKLTGSGDIHVHGDPTIDINDSGSGRVVDD